MTTVWLFRTYNVIQNLIVLYHDLLAFTCPVTSVTNRSKNRPSHFVISGRGGGGAESAFPPPPSPLLGLGVDTRRRRRRRRRRRGRVGGAGWLGCIKKL